MWEDAGGNDPTPIPAVVRQPTAARIQQEAAIAEFVEAMHRLKIPPRVHHFTKQVSDRHYHLVPKRTRHRLTGWDIDWPHRSDSQFADYVVTPDGHLFRMDLYTSNRKPKHPENLDFELTWGKNTETTLTQRLTTGLRRAVKRGPRPEPGYR